MRRCREDREFTEADATFWPVKLMDGGELYYYCPGKATWDHKTVLLYNSLLITVETGLPYQAGGVIDQPAWWVELASDFLTRYNDLRFYSRAKAILGDGKAAGAGKQQGAPKGNIRR